jgi:hypothetical protein
MQEVSKQLNIRGCTEDSSGVAFAPDALRIEVTGPIGYIPVWWIFQV